MIYIADTHAWIEYLNGSKKGIMLQHILENQKNKIITIECCIAEIISYSLREGRDYAKAIEVIKSNSVILPITSDIWIEAAIIRFELRKKIAHFGLIDAILVSKQKELNCKVVSGDPHFKTLKNVV